MNLMEDIVIKIMKNLENGQIKASWEIVKVGQGRNFGESQEYMMQISVFCRLPICCFCEWSAVVL